MFELKSARALFGVAAVALLSADAQAQNMTRSQSAVERGETDGREFARAYGFCPTDAPTLTYLGEDGVIVDNWDTERLGIQNMSERERYAYFLARGFACKEERLELFRQLTARIHRGTVETVE